MKDLFVKNSFTFGFLGLIFIFSLVFLYKFQDDTTQYIEVEVSYGETLWNIAQTYGSENVDIAKFVSHIEKENNLNGKTLRAGEVLRIPVNKHEETYLSMKE